MKALAPFPYYGCKAKIAKSVWNFLGNPKVYIEPFFGSGAILLSRPSLSSNLIEIVNDLDGHIVNVWRTLKFNPDSCLPYCEWPVSSLDLTARKIALLNAKESLEEKLKFDPEYYDSKLAGYWIWYACTSICCDMTSLNSMPNLMSNSGIHKMSMRYPDAIRECFSFLSKRLRYVKILCGDWSKACGNWLDKEKSVGIFLDPPYLGTEKTYYTRIPRVSEEVRKYCLEKGRLPNYRIVLCGYDEHEELLDNNWTVSSWQARGWFSKNDNRFKEKIYFSPSVKKLLY